MQPSTKSNRQLFLFASDASPSDTNHEDAPSKKSRTSRMHQPSARRKTQPSPQKSSMRDSGRGKFVESSDEEVSHRDRSVHHKSKGKMKSRRTFRAGSPSARYSSDDDVPKRQITVSSHKHARSQKLTWDSPSVEIVDDVPVHARGFKDRRLVTQTKVSMTSLLFSYESTYSSHLIDRPL